MPTKNPKRSEFFRRRRRPPGEEELRSRPERRRMRINKMKKGIFLLPSLLTLCSIFMSFYAIISALKGHFLLAGGLILAAAFFDGIDGRVAAAYQDHDTIRFGTRFTGRCHLIRHCFGLGDVCLGPGALWPRRMGHRVRLCCVRRSQASPVQRSVRPGGRQTLRWSSHSRGGLHDRDNGTFFRKVGLDPADYRIILLVFTYGLSFLMVSGVKFHAFKDLEYAKQKPFSSTVALVLILALIAASPLVVPFFLLAGYVASGPILTLVLHLRRKNVLESKTPEPEKVDAEATS